MGRGTILPAGSFRAARGRAGGAADSRRSRPVAKGTVVEVVRIRRILR